MLQYPDETRGRFAHGRRGFAVVDVETTGFRARGGDRIVEIAIVRIDRSGQVAGIYETLINPGQWIGASHVHHISHAMVADAPTFSEIAPTLLSWLNGTVLVAHNARFEDAFLAAEFERAGIRMPALPALDTLRLAQACVPTPNHKLATVTHWAGIRLQNAHTAFGDAHATAQLVPRLLDRTQVEPLWVIDMPKLQGSVQGRYVPRATSRP